MNGQQHIKQGTSPTRTKKTTITECQIGKETHTAAEKGRTSKSILTEMEIGQTKITTTRGADSTTISSNISTKVGGLGNIPPKMTALKYATLKSKVHATIHEDQKPNQIGGFPETNKCSVP